MRSFRSFLSFHLFTASFHPTQMLLPLSLQLELGLVARKPSTSNLQVMMKPLQHSLLSSIYKCAVFMILYKLKLPATSFKSHPLGSVKMVTFLLRRVVPVVVRKMLYLHPWLFLQWLLLWNVAQNLPPFPLHFLRVLRRQRSKLQRFQKSAALKIPLWTCNGMCIYLQFSVLFAYILIGLIWMLSMLVLTRRGLCRSIRCFWRSMKQESGVWRSIGTRFMSYQHISSSVVIQRALWERTMLNSPSFNLNTNLQMLESQ